MIETPRKIIEKSSKILEKIEQTSKIIENPRKIIENPRKIIEYPRKTSKILEKSSKILENCGDLLVVACQNAKTGGPKIKNLNLRLCAGAPRAEVPTMGTSTHDLWGVGIGLGARLARAAERFEIFGFWKSERQRDRALPLFEKRIALFR